MTTSWREPAPPQQLQELRCRSCRRLLAKSDGKGRVEVICKHCRTLNTFRTG